MVEDIHENEDRDNKENQVIQKMWPKDAVLALIASVESRYEDMHHALKRKYFWEHVAEDLQSINIIVSIV